MSEALAGEIAGFGIYVTIIEPGSFATDFRYSAKSAPPIDAYNPVRKATAASFKSEDRGDPAATAAAILAALDAGVPPLRLVLGSTAIPKFQDLYEQRLLNWLDWEEVSIAAQGKH